ncbi:MAG: hypothetical protein RL701_6697 [Pseudomonadota bacterium]
MPRLQLLAAQLVALVRLHLQLLAAPMQDMSLRAAVPQAQRPAPAVRQPLAAAITRVMRPLASVRLAQAPRRQAHT